MLAAEKNWEALAAQLALCATSSIIKHGNMLYGKSAIPRLLVQSLSCALRQKMAIIPYLESLFTNGFFD